MDNEVGFGTIQGFRDLRALEAFYTTRMFCRVVFIVRGYLGYDLVFTRVFPT